MSQKVKIKHALISVSDKSGLEPLVRALHRHGVTILSTGGTADFIEKLGGPKPVAVESVTQFPEMMDGRVKTLHPKIFGGVLARRDSDADLKQAKEQGIPLIDLVVVNLYPFGENLGKSTKEQSKFVDIGGPSLLRAAGKNHSAVAVLCHSKDYGEFIDHLDKNGGETLLEYREALAAKVFAHTSLYDALIAKEWLKQDFPNQFSFPNQIPLRYGENPHQKAVFCPENQNAWKQLQGKELSYNNLLDSDAAVRLAFEFENSTTVVIVKHNNPCGVASGNLAVSDIYQSALEGDPLSAFGGVVATNSIIDESAASVMSELFLEVIIAKGFSKEALELFSRKKNLRLIEWAKPNFPQYEIRQAMGGYLLQETDSKLSKIPMKVVTKVSPKSTEVTDLEFAWRVCKHVRSNAIVIAREGKTLGIGAGQMSRVDAVSLALKKAEKRNLKGAVLASDAFFPFRDNIDLLKDTGVSAVIQPGGSVRDPEVIDACNEHGIGMVFTDTRHFRH